MTPGSQGELVNHYTTVAPTVKPVLCPYSTQTMNPPNHKETINVRIRLDLWRFVNF